MNPTSTPEHHSSKSNLHVRILRLLECHFECRQANVKRMFGHECRTRGPFEYFEIFVPGNSHLPVHLQHMHIDLSRELQVFLPKAVYYDPL